jgi:hypothetical protein
MINTYLIFRFGIPHPTQEEVELIFDITEGNPEGGPFPGAVPTGMSGVMSLIKSKLSADEISNRFQQMSIGMENDTEEANGSVYPVIVTKVDPSNFSYNRDMSEVGGWGDSFARMTSKVEADGEPSVDHLGLDDLLDIMKVKGGFTSLSKAEQERLQKLSQ